VNNHIEYSAIIPLFNEESSILPLHSSLRSVLDKLSFTYEIIYVNDGSTDSSLKILEKIRRDFPSIKLVSFKTNKGQSEAFLAGFKESRGRWIITLDADLQNPPEEIPKLLEFKNNFDLITGVRRKRKDNIVKKSCSSCATAARYLILRDTTKDPGCFLKVFKRKVLETIPHYRNFHRFFTYLARKKGFKVKEIPVEHRKRQFGKSKYGILKRAKEGIVDLRHLSHL